MVITQLVVSINTAMNEYYIAAIFLASILIVYIGFYIILVKYPDRIKYGILLFNNLVLFLPIALLIYILYININV